MNNFKKRIIFITVIIVLVVIIAILIYYLLFKSVAEPTVNENVNGNLPYNPPINLNTNNAIPSAGEQVFVIPSQDETQVKVISQNFSEKYGSYSNQSDLENFSDLLSLSTSAMQSYLQNLIKTVDSESDDYYHGITTKTLKVAIINISDSSAETLVTTQRTETDESQNILNKVYYQDLKLNLIKSQDQWKVDGAWWQ